MREERAEVCAAERETVLVLEPDELLARRIRDLLSGPAREVLVATTAREALALLPDANADLVVARLETTDLADGRLVEALRRSAPGVPVLATCDERRFLAGVEAMRRGACDVVPCPPLSPRQLLEAVDRALGEARARGDLERARAQVRDRAGFSHMLTRSPRMLRVFDQVRAVASTDATVLILGETGTGKELVSRAIHERSRRADRPFIGVNCGAFTESLLESELFGHERGSFTGAEGRRRGVFELADGGTLFLDELGETSLSVQVNLLRVLEDMCFRRVGGQELVHVDVRIIAATNVDLERAVHSGRFREDLYYRLNVFPIRLPPLRERREDIPLLARHFLEDAARAYGLEPPRLSGETLEAITAYRWPGNVRQLRALCERWAIVAHGRAITMDDLPPEMTGRAEHPEEELAAFSVDEALPLRAVVDRAVAHVERVYLQRLLRLHRGNVSRTAAAAGITRRTLYTKLREYGLHAADFRAPR